MVAAALAATGIALCGAATAQATYPGANGDIAFTRLGNPGYYTFTDIWLAGADGTNQRLLFQAEDSFYMGDPSYSADGRRLAWEGRSRFNFGSSYVANADGTGVQRLPYESKEPALSPDGTRLAYRHDSNNPDDVFPTGLYVSDIDGSNRVDLGLYKDPDWSPDGTTLVAREAGGTNENDPAEAELYTIPVDGGPAHRLTATAASESHPSWSPDGQWIAYTRQEGFDPPEVWVMHPDGDFQRKVTVGADPVWSPDGQRILFEHAAGSGGYDTDLWTIRPDGRDATRLIAGAWDAAWQPLPGQPFNHTPTCSSVHVTPTTLPWRTDDRMHRVRLVGGSDPDGDRVAVEVAWIGQDEPVTSRDDRTSPDARWTGNPRVALLRDERARHGNGRVYWIDYWVTDPSGARCLGTATVGVPRSGGRPAVASDYYASSVLLPGESHKHAVKRRNKLHR
jgi:WD40-like Beta Propeller Repeat